LSRSLSGALVVPAPGLRIVYRIVRTDPPTLADLTSAAALGRPPPRTPELARLYDGLSVFSTERQARNKARDLPVLGTYLAAVALEDGAPVRLERTLRGSPGHHTLWGDPEALRRRVVAVVPV
jgi:hypothetical protein